jgi:quercetin dioxygenase-like cupin family protein
MISRRITLAAAVVLATASFADGTPGTDVLGPDARAEVALSPPQVTGRVRLMHQYRREPPSRIAGALVAFDPGSRTAWHSHPFGQTLIVTKGTGFVQHWGGKREVMREGDVVWTPPGVRHWHGAAPTESMTHVAIVETDDGRTVEWFEPVTDRQYAGEQ